MTEGRLREGLTSATALVDQNFAGYRAAAPQGEEATARAQFARGPSMKITQSEDQDSRLRSTGSRGEFQVTFGLTHFFVM